MVQVTEYRAARQNRDVIHFGQRLNRLTQPFVCAPAAEHCGGRKQRAAALTLLVGNDDTGAGMTSGQSRHQPGRTGAGDEHVAVCVAMIIVIGIREQR